MRPAEEVAAEIQPCLNDMASFATRLNLRKRTIAAIKADRRAAQAEAFREATSLQCSSPPHEWRKLLEARAAELEKPQ